MNVLINTRRRELTGYRAVVATFMGAALTAACAKLAFYLPGSHVPVSGQVFAVALCGMVLGSRLGALAQIEYVTAGLLGAPVFAGVMKAGPMALVGPTGGYLTGFIVQAFVTGMIIERAQRVTFPTAWFAGLFGVGVMYTLGAGWLAVWGGAQFTGITTWMMGVAPFVGLDATKVALAAGICCRK